MKRWTIKYTIDNKTKEKTLSDSYISMTRINKPSVFSDVLDNVPILTNIDDTAAFRADLLNYEKKTSSNNGRQIYGVVLSFLLDKDHSDEDLAVLTNEINKRYENLPFYAYRFKQGKAYYLNIYYCERYYYPDGHRIDVKAVQDVYKDRETKQYCSSESENAYIYKKQGEVIRTRMVKFSNKTSHFRFKEYEFTRIWNEFKLWFMQLLHNLFGMIIEDGVSFTQFVVHKTKKKNKAAARLWNRTFRKMNDYMNDAIRALSAEDDFEHHRKTLSQIAGYYLTMIRKQEFECDGRRFYISLNPRNKEYNKMSSEILYNSFINNIISAIYG